MRTYESFASNLRALLGDDPAVKLVVAGYMPLTIERIGTTHGGHLLIAMAHTGVQNGDVMFDPEIVFQLHVSGDQQAAEPVSFRNDYLGMNQEVYRYNDEGKATHVDVRLKAELKDFAQMWFRNLEDQGFFSPKAVRERLG